jgi:hypothetical protein
MRIKKYQDFILETNGDDLISKLSKLNIKDVNYLLNDLITSDSQEKPRIIEELIDELQSRKIDISDMKEELKKISSENENN